MTAANAIRGKRNKRAGKVGESIALVRLRQPKTRAIVGAHPIAAVAGDIRAVVPGGRSVLVEVKARPGRLCWSDLEPHQVANLDEHQRAGGLSLLAYVYPGGCAVMVWRPIGLEGPRCSLTPDHFQTTLTRLWAALYCRRLSHSASVAPGSGRRWCPTAAMRE